LEIYLSLGGLLWYNLVDKVKKCSHVLFDSLLCKKKKKNFFFLSFLKKMRKLVTKNKKMLSKPVNIHEEKKEYFSKVGAWHCPFYVNELAPFLSV